MQSKRLLAVVMLPTVPITAQVKVVHFIPTSEEVSVASMAARDQGFDLNASNIFLDELRTKDGQNPIPGYESIGLYQDDHLVREYDIRIDTGDVVDSMSCVIFQYPNLLRFKRATIRDFGTHEVSLKQIAADVGCDSLRPIGNKNNK